MSKIADLQKMVRLKFSQSAISPQWFGASGVQNVTLNYLRAASRRPNGVKDERKQQQRRRPAVEDFTLRSYSTQIKSLHERKEL
jgi:poly-D-alanine transfer protein DltD